jgi:UDP-glucuronate decarboxylase
MQHQENRTLIDKLIREDIEAIRKDLKQTNFEGIRVLITGGAGFLGSWLCDVFMNLNAETICVDNLSTGLAHNIDHLIGKQKFRFKKANICTLNEKDCIDYIFHMASHASPEEYQTRPIETLLTTSLGSTKMAELARKQDATLFFASTSEVYGDAEVVPTPENYWGNVNPIGPRSCYDEGKRFAEALFMAYHKQYGLDVKIARIFNSFGPRLRADGLYGRAVSRFITQALTNKPITIYGDGTQSRSFCYITDTITGLLLLTLNDKARGEVVNVGNPREITILQLAQKTKEQTKSKSSLTFHPLPKDDPKRRCPDITKIEKLLGWKSKISLGQGLDRTITWFQYHVK